VVAVTNSCGDTAEKIKYRRYGEAMVTVQQGQSATGERFVSAEALKKVEPIQIRCGVCACNTPFGGREP